MGYKFGKRSLEVLDTLEDDLKRIMNEAIATSDVDFSLVQGARTVEQQQEYFDEGASRINPKKYPSVEALAEKAKHIVCDKYPKSRAVDIIAYVPGFVKQMAYDKSHLAYIACHILATAKRLYKEGKVKKQMRWGGNWDRDGVLLVDQNLKDMPHFELI